MATPIETNTEGLSEILNQVYNLPNRSAGGSEPDLVLCPNDNYWDPSGPEQETVDFEPSQVVNVYQKVLAGEDVNVIISGRIAFNSAARSNDCVIYKASMAAVTESINELRVVFPGYIYNYNSASATIRVYEVYFNVDVNGGTASITSCSSLLVGSA